METLREGFFLGFLSFLFALLLLFTPPAVITTGAFMVFVTGPGRSFFSLLFRARVNIFYVLLNLI